MTRRHLLAALAVLPALLLASCGVRAVGYGVVLWGVSDGAPPTGMVVPVIRESPVNSSYLISVQGQKQLSEIPMGRLRFFKKRADADTYARGYSAFLPSWALVMKLDGTPLPIRDSASQDGKLVYRLQPKQLIKVISRSAAPVTVPPYTDYWYEVATEDGSSGWTFGHYLKLFSVQGDPGSEADRLRNQDDNLDRLMSTVWRPGWFQDQIAAGAIDLTMFRDDVGLFPDPANKSVKLVLPLSTLEFHYDSIQNVGPAAYNFLGADLRVSMMDQTTIEVQYHLKGQLVRAVYVDLDADVSQLVANEQKRRSDLFDGLVQHGATLTSSAYGTIRLQTGMRFTWEGFGRLVPTLIGPSAKGAGSVDFPLHVGRHLTGTYDGVITLTFDEYPQSPVNFLYKSTDNGLRLTSVAAGGIQDLIVNAEGISPVVIFFTVSP